MEIIKIENKFCISCMKTHDLKTVRIKESATYKGTRVEYYATYYYCDETGDIWAQGNTVKTNFDVMHEAYKRRSND